MSIENAADGGAKESAIPNGTIVAASCDGSEELPAAVVPGPEGPDEEVPDTSVPKAFVPGVELNTACGANGSTAGMGASAPVQAPINPKRTTRQAIVFKHAPHTGAGPQPEAGLSRLSHSTYLLPH